ECSTSISIVNSNNSPIVQRLNFNDSRLKLTPTVQQVASNPTRSSCSPITVIRKLSLVTGSGNVFQKAYSCLPQITVNSVNVRNLVKDQTTTVTSIQHGVSFPNKGIHMFESFMKWLDKLFGATVPDPIPTPPQVGTIGNHDSIPETLYPNHTHPVAHAIPGM